MAKVYISTKDKNYLKQLLQDIGQPTLTRLAGEKYKYLGHYLKKLKGTLIPEVLENAAEELREHKELQEYVKNNKPVTEEEINTLLVKVTAYGASKLGHEIGRGRSYWSTLRKQGTIKRHLFNELKEQINEYLCIN